MRYVNHHTTGYYTSNGDLSSFNRIKRSSFVRSDDAVETFKRQQNNKIYAARIHLCKNVELYIAEDKLVHSHVHVMNLVKISQKDWK